MNDEKMYSADEVCKALKVSSWTLSNWYRWEQKRVDAGEENRLPKPIKLEHTKGKPRRWTKEMIEQLKDFKKSLVTGRNGIYGVYTNPYHKETKKYKKSVGIIENE